MVSTTGATTCARPGEAIIQPGYADQNFCPAGNDSADTVAHFTSRKKIKWGADKVNKVDLAIAEVVPGAVKPNGEILKVGVPGSEPVRPFVGLRVQKSGRTTGLTRGVVTAVDVSVIIEDFPLDCAGTETRLAIFSKQIIIAGEDGKKFLDSGDSGSLPKVRRFFRNWARSWPEIGVFLWSCDSS